MADVKITALTAISSNPVNPATFPIPMVDLLDNTITASGTTKKVTVNQILGAGGTATLASATITGALTVDTSTLVVDATNDRVGIGTATPGRPLEVYNTTESTVWAKTTTGISLFRSGGTSGDFYFGIDNSTGAGFGQGNYSRLIYSTGAYPIVFSTNATERARFNSTGNLAFANGLGIDFSAVTGGTGTATGNVLNDYEEGTFTPTLTFGGASVGMIGTFSGRYTKVGRAVTVSGLITITTRGTSTGNATIGGLPFTSAAGDYVAASLRLASISFTDAFQGYVSQSSTAIVLEQITNAGTESALTHSNFSVGSSFLIWNCTYTV